MSRLDWIVIAPMLALTVGSVLSFLLGAFLPKSRMASWLALLSIGTAFALQGKVWETGQGPVFSGLYETTPFNSLLGFLFLTLTTLAWGFASSSISEDEAKSEFFGMMLLACAGMFLLAGAKNLLLIFLGVEILSIPLYFLCAFRHHENASIEAGLKYFLLGAFAAAFLLFGSAMIYAATGSISLPEIATKAKQLAGGETALFQGGMALLLVGILFKASLAPFHFWTPDVYEGAPTPVTALMAGGTKAAAFGALVNLVPLFFRQIEGALVAAALLTLLIGNFAALQQISLKRMLAYSGIAHAGILLIGVLSWPAGSAASQAVLFYLVSYGLTSAGAFGLVAYLEKEDGAEMAGLEGLRGLCRRRPIASLALMIFLLSLGGIPPTAGFLGKYMIFAAAIEAKMTWLAVIGILFSVVALGYYLRVIVTMYMLPAPQNAPVKGGWDLFSLFATGTAALGILIFGLQPRILMNWIG